MTPLEAIAAVAPDELRFPGTYVSDQAVRSLSVENAGTAAFDVVEIVIDGEPFTVDPPTARILPGSRTTFTVAFSPQAPGPRTGTLRLLLDADNIAEHTVALLGEGLPVPACEAAECHEANFDVDQQRCVDVRAPNGTPCASDACATASVCIDGACVAEDRSQECDDGDPCTIDTCDGVVGCRNVLDPSPCDDENPCTIDSCDAAVGCSSTPAPDGTYCGIYDPCLGVGICTAGVCVDQPLIGNAACDDFDACTVNDQCLEGQCTGAPLVSTPPVSAPTPLPLTFGARFDDARRLAFEGHGLGLLVWSNEDEAAPELMARLDVGEPLRARPFRTAQGLLVAVGLEGGLYLVDVATPTEPALVAAMTGLAPNALYAEAAGYVWQRSSAGLHRLDVANPAAPTWVQPEGVTTWLSTTDQTPLDITGQGNWLALHRDQPLNDGVPRAVVSLVAVDESGKPAEVFFVEPEHPFDCTPLVHWEGALFCDGDVEVPPAIPLWRVDALGPVMVRDLAMAPAKWRSTGSIQETITVLLGPPPHRYLLLQPVAGDLVAFLDLANPAAPLVEEPFPDREGAWALGDGRYRFENGVVVRVTEAGTVSSFTPSALAGFFASATDMVAVDPERPYLTDGNWVTGWAGRLFPLSLGALGEVEIGAPVVLTPWLGGAAYAALFEEDGIWVGRGRGSSNETRPIVYRLVPGASTADVVELGSIPGQWDLVGAGERRFVAYSDELVRIFAGGEAAQPALTELSSIAVADLASSGAAIRALATPVEGDWMAVIVDRPEVERRALLFYLGDPTAPLLVLDEEAPIEGLPRLTVAGRTVGLGQRSGDDLLRVITWTLDGPTGPGRRAHAVIDLAPLWAALPLEAAYSARGLRHAEGTRVVVEVDGYPGRSVMAMLDLAGAQPDVPLVPVADEIVLLPRWLGSVHRTSERMILSVTDHLVSVAPPCD